MPLSLDLSGSRAKVARAREHYDGLRAEIDKENAENGPPFNYIVTPTNNSGTFEVRLRAGPFENLRYAAIIGDIVHDLRSALDYIVVALADASKAALGSKHQFPIFDDRRDYVGKSPKMLRGVLHGLDLIESLQPYHRVPPRYDVLFQLNYFSNSDKHRLISRQVSIVMGTTGKIRPQEGIASQEIFDHPQQWMPNDEQLIAVVTYAEPFPDPDKVDVTGEVQLTEAFAAPAFGKHNRGFIVPFEFFKDACDHIGMIVDRFEQL